MQELEFKFDNNDIESSRRTVSNAVFARMATGNFSEASSILQEYQEFDREGTEGIRADVIREYGTGL